MSQPDEKKTMAQYADIVAGLDAIRRRIDSASFPGQAWPGQRRFARRVAAVSVAVAAAAAVVLFAFALYEPSPVPSGPIEVVAHAPVAPPSLATATLYMDMPTSLDLSAVGQLAMDIPAVNVPPVNKIAPSATLDWHVPSLSMPSLEQH